MGLDRWAYGLTNGERPFDHPSIDHSKWELASAAEGQQPEGAAAAAPAAGEGEQAPEDDLKGWQLVRFFGFVGGGWGCRAGVSIALV